MAVDMPWKLDVHCEPHGTDLESSNCEDGNLYHRPIGVERAVCAFNDAPVRVCGPPTFENGLRDETRPSLRRAVKTPGDECCESAVS
jgi:hypothetical protein